MADPVISVVIERLFAIVEERVSEEISLVRGVEKEVNRLSKMMKGIQAILDDADNRRVEETVKFWLDQFEEVVYDTDDVLDEWNYQLLKKQINGGTDEDDVKKVRCSFLSPLSCFRQVIERREIALKIKELKERMDSIFIDKEKFSFQPSKLDRNHEYKPLETISCIDESQFGGRDIEKESLVTKLLSLDDTAVNKSDVDVISIVGTGGLGKTTLAQLAYNDNRVKDHFNHRIWVCVSDPFDVAQVAKKMLEHFTRGAPSSCSMQTLTTQIKELVSGKKVLVLDDVWPHESKKWEMIRNSFIKQVTPLSKVLVTTRDRGVAESMSTKMFQKLGVLSESDCWHLVSRIALSNRDEVDKPTFEKVGREISKKCSGLPLAAVTIGSALIQKKTLGEWYGVLNSKIWELKPVKLELFPPLFLNFIQFPLELRRCFKYCSIFPKDYQIWTDDLIQMWMSQGYISSNRSSMDIGEKGYEYVENLVSCSFFQDMSRRNGRIIGFKIHDIVHDFAQYLMEKECSAVGGENSNQIEATNLRHLTLLSSFDVANFSCSSSLGKVRSLFVDKVPLKRFEILLQHLKYVRLLKLKDCGLVKLPEEIKLLIHLRKLDLSNNLELEDLPEGICQLFNLETLNLFVCLSLSKLPQDIGNLINLVHLHIAGTDDLKHLPKGILKLKKLRTLDRFLVGEDIRFEDLKSMSQIEGCLNIEFFEKVNKIDDGLVLANKDKIKTLALAFAFKIQGSIDMLEVMQSPPNLHSLHLSHFVVDCPNSIFVSSFCDIKSLDLRYCTIPSLPVLWKLQNLETLSILDPRGLEHVGVEFLGIESNGENSKKASSYQSHIVAFPKLKMLKFHCCDNLNKWEDVADRKGSNGISIIMPCLVELKVRYCEKLEDLPHALLSMLPKLRILNITNSRCLLRRLIKDEKWVNAHWRSQVTIKPTR